MPLDLVGLLGALSAWLTSGFTLNSDEGLSIRACVALGGVGFLVLPEAFAQPASRALVGLLELLVRFNHAVLRFVHCFAAIADVWQAWSQILDVIIPNIVSEREEEFSCLGLVDLLTLRDTTEVGASVSDIIVASSDPTHDEVLA